MPPMESQGESEDPTFAEDQSLQDEWETNYDLTETTLQSTSDHLDFKATVKLPPSCEWSLYGSWILIRTLGDCCVGPWHCTKR
uniref:Uncharacterized protein n=1 Tax=Romanomermis culicivorax TaxID=13658 RepID=A0A915J2L4_ROMCU